MKRHHWGCLAVFFWAVVFVYILLVHGAMDAWAYLVACIAININESLRRPRPV